VKVIAGTLGGRKLKTLSSQQTRPTAAKIRGAIFNTLGQYFPAETRTLDLFAGSGALAIEAISRGSGGATMVDNNRLACNIIKENIQTLQIEEQVRVYCGSYTKYLASVDETFDLIFIDPPYAMKIIASTLEQLITRGFVRRGGRIIIEVSTAIYEANDLQFLTAYNVIFDRTYDTTRIIIIEQIEGEKL